MKRLSLLLLGLPILLVGCGAHNVREGAECKSTGDCARPLACSAGVCVREHLSQGGKCKVDADCMGTLRCIDKKCQ